MKIVVPQKNGPTPEITNLEHEEILKNQMNFVQSKPVQIEVKKEEKAIPNNPMAFSKPVV